jgi:hypothetical protein
MRISWLWLWTVRCCWIWESHGCDYEQFDAVGLENLMVVTMNSSMLLDMRISWLCLWTVRCCWKWESHGCDYEQFDAVGHENLMAVTMNSSVLLELGFSYLWLNSSPPCWYLKTVPSNKPIEAELVGCFFWFVAWLTLQPRRWRCLFFRNAWPCPNYTASQPGILDTVQTVKYWDCINRCTNCFKCPQIW